MKERRQFLKTALGALAGVGVFFTSWHSFLRPLWGEERKTILPKGTKRESLVERNPADLDTRNLDITPLKDFQTMGTTENKVDLEKWRLEVTGRVKRALVLTYSQVLGLPSTERRVLLICPGFFSNNGLWKGILMEELLKKAEREIGANRCNFHFVRGRAMNERRNSPWRRSYRAKSSWLTGSMGRPSRKSTVFPFGWWPRDTMGASGQNTSER